MRYLNLALIAGLMVLSLSSAAATCDDISNLRKVISGSNDSKMGPNDLAFFLATHSYDVTPKGSYVEVRLDGHVYKVTPNGNHPEITDLN